MAFFTWKEDYSVGVESLDAQHKKLVELLNSLYESMHQGRGKEDAGKVLTGLINYTRDHFFQEEALMRLYQYPEYETHKIKHLKMTNKVKSLAVEWDAGDIKSTQSIADFLKGWLSKHIIQTDKAYGAHLRSKGAV